MRLEVRGNLGRFAAALDLHADEDVRGLRIGDPVVELGDVAVADERAEALEAAALLGDRNREHGFARFTTSARSATKRIRSKFMFAPDVTATSVWFSMPSRSA